MLQKETSSLKGTNLRYALRIATHTFVNVSHFLAVQTCLLQLKTSTAMQAQVVSVAEAAQAAQGMAAAVGSNNLGPGQDQITDALAKMPRAALFDIMAQMKGLIQQNQQQARQILVTNPSLTRALFQAQIMLGMLKNPLSADAMPQQGTPQAGPQPLPQPGPGPQQQHYQQPPIQQPQHQHAPAMRPQHVPPVNPNVQYPPQDLPPQPQQNLPGAPQPMRSAPGQPMPGEPFSTLLIELTPSAV